MRAISLSAVTFIASWTAGICWPSYSVLGGRAGSLKSAVLLVSTTSSDVSLSPSPTFAQFQGQSITQHTQSDCLLALNLVSGDVRASIKQETTGTVPRSQQPAALVLDPNSPVLSELDLFFIVEESLRWYLDAGGRIKQLLLYAPDSLHTSLNSMGFDSVLPHSDLNQAQKSLDSKVSRPNYNIYQANSLKIMEHSSRRLSGQQGVTHTLYDILGRLQHDASDPQASIDSYTKALMAKPESASTFRNLGSAYQAVGNAQMAFASYQQSVQLDPSDALVYLKLAFFYEDFAKKDWVDAEEHAEKCYRYYLEKVDSEDTAVLLRLGNLLLREGQFEKAIAEYEKILMVNNNMVEAWFNSAHAFLKLNENSKAKHCLERTIALDPSILAAKHMLNILSDKVEKMEVEYVKELFDNYAEEYDDHIKKLFYSAPRVIRQELGKIYKENKMGQEELLSTLVSQPPPEGGHCASYTSFMNQSLDILDLGCGTGQMGAWLKDYAKTLTGVDLSSEMIKKCGKKMIYQQLHTVSAQDFLKQSHATFDLIVATEVFNYIGELTEVMGLVQRKLRAQGLFVFTIETLLKDSQKKGYELMLNGRFGHTKEYVDGLLTAHKDEYNVVMARDFSPRLEHGEPVKGFLYIIQKK